MIFTPQTESEGKLAKTIFCGLGNPGVLYVAE